MITCTARFHQGEEFAEVTGSGNKYDEAFYDAALTLPRGLRVSDSNLQGGITLLTRWQAGDYGGVPIASPVKEAYAYLSVTDQLQPEINIGWVTFRFTEEARKVRLYAITAQVNVDNLPWSSSQQVPTFYLDPVVQGIVDERHAERIADDILTTAAALGDEHVSYVITAEAVY
jgi:hypothetical protein